MNGSGLEPDESRVEPVLIQIQDGHAALPIESGLAGIARIEKKDAVHRLGMGPVRVAKNHQVRPFAADPVAEFVR